MKPRNPPCSIEELRNLLHYDPDTGIILRNKIIKNKVVPTVVGFLDKSKNNRRIKIYNKSYIESHIIWFYMTGSWPSMIIDHIDGNPSNNKWNNLREATHSQNSYNKIVNKNTTGVKGVVLKGYYKDGSPKYRASITINYKKINLGVYKNLDDAKKAYETAAEYYQGDYAVHKSRDGY